jgi:hypothetical protein
VKEFAGSDDACPKEERCEMRDRTQHTASYAGLTRVSINLRKSLPKKMDCRVKPGNDDEEDVDGRVKPGHDEKPVWLCCPKAVIQRKNP